MFYSHSIFLCRLLGLAILLSTTFALKADVVTGFTLIDSDADTVLFALQDGDTLDLGILPPDLALRAETDTVGIGSVYLELIGDEDTTARIDNTSPYTVHGDGSGNYFGFRPEMTTYSLSGTPYQYGGGTGAVGTGLTINITFGVADPEPAPIDTGAYLEAGGLVVIEAETTETSGKLTFRSNLDGYTGDGYLEWKYGDYSPGIDWSGGGPHVTYEIKISTPGRYRYQYRTAAIEPNEHNDIWVRFPDNGAVAINALDTLDLTTGWFKVYQNESDNEWTWETKTVDGDAHSVYTDFDSAGTYRLQFAGRSTLFKIDRMVLYNDSVSSSAALDITNPESLREGEEPPVFVCEMPLNPTTGIVNPTKANVSWDPVAEADGYLIQGRRQGDSTWITKKSLNNFKSFNIFIPGESYEWRVAAGCLGGSDTSDFTAIQPFTMPPVLRDQISNVTNLNISSYPNPASNSLTINGIEGTESLEIRDITGRLVHTANITNSDNVTLIDVSDWIDGIYLVRLTDSDQGQIYTHKVQVQH